MRVQHRRNQKRKRKTTAMDRYGVSLMWKVAPKEMTEAGVLPMGSYDRWNVHGGVIWGWRHEVPLNERSVKRIFNRIIEENRLSPPQLCSVRKALSYQ